MQTCPLRRAWVDAGATKSTTRRETQCAASTSPSHSASRAERWMGVVISLSSLIGWHALANLLTAIPDSNDDFSVF